MGGQVIVCIPADNNVKALITSQSDVSPSSENKTSDHSDLIPGIYEGGTTTRLIRNLRTE